MIKTIRNAVLILTASLLATTALKADDSQKQVRNLENRVSALEQRKSSGGIILPPVYPIVKNGANLGISAELLYWKTRQDNDCYAVAYGPIADPTTGPVGKVRGHTPHYKWDTGFRLGLDYGIPHDGWNTTLDWTHIRNTAHASSGGQNYEMVNAPGNGVNPRPSLVNSSQHSKLELDILDLDLGRAFFTSKWLTLRPFAGLRATWIDQKFVSTFKQNNQVLIQLTRKNHTKGIGLRAGVDAEWGLGTGFSIFTDGAIGLIYTRFQPSVKSLGNEVSADNSQTYRLINNYRKDYYESKLDADLALGLQWEGLFSQDRFGLRLRAGWEQHLFVNQGMIPTYTQQSNQILCDATTGDLSIQGWVFSAKFDF